MTSEDWVKVLLGLVTAIVTVLGPIGLAYAEFLRRKLNSAADATATNARNANVAANVAAVTAANVAVAADTAAAKAADAADKACLVASETKTLMNGRLEQMLADARKAAYSEGYAAGTKTVMAAVAESPKVSLDAQGVAKAVADSVVVKND